MNNVTLAHIGGELVLIGGVAFYFHRKTNSLQETVNRLSNENEELVKAVEHLGKQVQELIKAMQYMQQTQARYRPAPPQPVQQAPPMASRTHGLPEGLIGTVQSVVGGGARPVSRKKKKRQQPVRAMADSESDDSGNETLDDRDLDNMLKDEYNQLNRERQDCTGDTCKLIDND